MRRTGRERELWRRFAPQQQRQLCAAWAACGGAAALPRRAPVRARARSAPLVWQGQEQRGPSPQAAAAAWARGGAMDGRLFRYGAGAAQRVAFASPPSPPAGPPLAARAGGPGRAAGGASFEISGDISGGDGGGEDARIAVVAIGGLTDGLMPAPWVAPLGAALSARDDGAAYTLIQPLLRSSYSGYGTCTLTDDVEDLAMLIAHLKGGGTAAERASSKLPVFGKVALAGHSTGCQISVAYTRAVKEGAAAGGDGTPSVDAVVLQAPVSDREYAETLPGTADALERARALVLAGDKDECMRRADNYDGTPITAERFLSLSAAGGADDMVRFSSDLSDAQLDAALGHLRGTPTLVLTSGADEYVPSKVNKAELTQRLAAACNGRPVVIDGADHACSGAATADAVERMVGFLVDALER